MKYVNCVLWAVAGVIFGIKWFITALVEGSGDGAQYLAVFLACYALFKLEFVKTKE